MDPRWEVDFLNAWHYAERAEVLAAGAEGAEWEAVRRATRTREPLGAEEFVMALEWQTGRKLRVLARGRPRKIVEVDKHSERQAELFATAAGWSEEEHIKMRLSRFPPSAKALAYMP